MKKKWVRILLWIFCFPVPLWFLIKDKDLNKTAKTIIMSVAITLYTIIAISGLARSCSTNKQANTTYNIKSISSSYEQSIDLDLNHEYTKTKSSSFNVETRTSKGFDGENILLISENPEIVTIKYTYSSFNSISFEVTGISAGSTYIYATTKDNAIISNKILVNVKAVDPTPTPSPTPTPTPTNTPTPTPEPEETNAPEYKSREVYVSSSGIYHYNSSCGNLKNYRTMSEDEALDKGYRGCKKCT